MSIVSQLTADYARFPQQQSYDLYTESVYFQDPLVTFRGIKRYRAMIDFMEQWFHQVQMELHQIEQVDAQIHTRWTLRWIAPLPWKPTMVISGTSTLTLNDQGLIESHVDRWDCSPWSVFTQLFQRRPSSN
jgi:hypothetical protein